MTVTLTSDYGHDSVIVQARCFLPDDSIGGWREHGINHTVARRAWEFGPSSAAQALDSLADALDREAEQDHRMQFARPTLPEGVL